MDSDELIQKVTDLIKPPKPTKQVIVIRNDLNMRKGKMVVQGSHAVQKALIPFHYFYTAPSGEQFLMVPILQKGHVEPLKEWLEGKYTKACVQVDTEKELIDLYNKAKLNGIMCSLITDLGITEFHNIPTNTAIVIGPSDPEEIDKITGHLKLL